MIGAHGKLKNWMSKRQLDVSAVKILVFDEADQMLEVSAALTVASLALVGQTGYQFAATEMGVH